MVRIFERDHWTEVSIPTWYGAQEMFGAILQGSGHAYRKLLVDATAVGPLNDPAIHAKLGQLMAMNLARAPRIAVLVPEEIASGSSERAAANLAVPLRVFTDRVHAEAWLADA